MLAAYTLRCLPGIVEGNVMCRHLRGLDYRLLPITIMLLFLTARCAFSQESGIGTVVDNFLIPIPVPSGLCSDRSSLWVGDYAITSGSSSIYKIDLWTHQIVDNIPSPGAWDAGLSRTDSAIWEFTDYPTFEDFALAKLSTSGKILKYFPARSSCYWSGIAWDGKDLYYGTNICFASPKGQKAMIYKVHPETGAVIDSFPPPSGHINGLVYNNGDLWYCDDNNGYIFEIDTTGKILREFLLRKDQIPFHGPLSGLTIARHYLWAVDMAGGGGPRIYEIDIGETPAVPEMFGCYTGPGYPGEIKVAWRPSSSPDVEKYKIYRQGPFQSGYGNRAEASVIASVPGNDTSYVDSIGTSGLAFTYWVSAVDSAGVESQVSQGFTGAA